MFSKRSMFAAASLALVASLAQAQISDGVVKIGVLSDMSSLYSDIAGSGSTVAARMAVEDFGAARKGMKVEILSADHLNKPDVGSSIARQRQGQRHRENRRRHLVFHHRRLRFRAGAGARYRGGGA